MLKEETQWHALQTHLQGELQAGKKSAGKSSACVYQNLPSWKSHKTIIFVHPRSLEGGTSFQHGLFT